MATIHQVLNYLIETGINYEGTFYQIPSGERRISPPANEITYANVIIEVDGVLWEKPPQGAIDAIIAIIDGEDATMTSNLNAILTLAQGAVGKTPASTTTAERWALLGVLIYAAGGIDLASGQIKPLNQWAFNGEV